MAVKTLIELSDDEAKRRSINRDMRLSNSAQLQPSQKWAVVLISLAPDVSQPADYSAIRQAIEAIQGIQSIHLLIDGRGAPAEIPADDSLVLHLHAQLQSLPEEP